MLLEQCKVEFYEMATSGNWHWCHWLRIKKASKGDSYCLWMGRCLVVFDLNVRTWAGLFRLNWLDSFWKQSLVLMIVIPVMMVYRCVRIFQGAISPSVSLGG